MTIRLPEKFSPSGKFILVALIVSLFGLAVPALASAAWTVDSTGDQTDAALKNGSCKTAVNTCTLRAAIEESNAEGNTQEIFFGPTFNGKTGSTIVLGSALPSFHPERGEINGVSAGACMTSSLVTGPCVEIDAPAGAKALALTGTGEMTVKGLDLTGGEVGLEALSADPLVAEENWIGMKLDGTAAPATGTGINVGNAATIVGNTISGGPVGIHTSGSDPAGNGLRKNLVSGATTAGLLIENSSNQIFGNQVSKSAIGIRVHDSTGAADENRIGGVQSGATDPDANLITGSTGAAIEINTAASTTTSVLRNSGSGNGGPFISLVKKSAGETKGPNEGIQPPVITTATLSGASGTAEPESFVRVYANSTASEGEMGTFLGRAEADPTTGAWSLTYSASAATAKIAASQTAGEDERGSSALASAQPQFTLKVLKGGTGTGTVTSAPGGISCGAQCEASFAKGGALKLLAAPAAGSLAVVWTGCDAVNGAGECEVTMSAAKLVTATFDLAPTSGGGGGGGGSSTPAPTPTPKPTKPAPPKKPLKCKAGFKKKTVKGKARCVKVKKAHKKHH